MANVVLAPAHAALLKTWTALDASAVAVSHTGDTTETALATITVAAGAMGANGILRVTTLWSGTSSANNKTPRVRFGGVSGTQFLATILTTNPIAQLLTIIRNRNVANSQVGWNEAESVPYGANNSALKTGTQNTALAKDLVISGQLANAGETITLEAYIIELLSKA